MQLRDIHILASKDTFIQPSVDFEVSTGECNISGESFLEESGKFYSPLVDWIKNYVVYGKKLTFTFKLTYFNTSTSKWILTILSELKNLEDAGVEVEVNWYFHEDDVDMRDDISDYMDDTGLKINLIPFKE